MATPDRAGLLRGSTLVRSGGWRVLRLLPDGVLAALAAEASACHGTATESVVLEPRDADPRRGHPDRWLESAAGGPALRQLYSSASLQQLLATLTGMAWRPSGLQASYSFYRAPGHYLGLHRDVDVCDLAVIACVADGGPAEGLSGMLSVYPSRAGDDLADVRAGRRGMVPVPMVPGEAVVLVGGVVPHEVHPVGPGRCRVVAPMCFQPAA